MTTADPSRLHMGFAAMMQLASHGPDTFVGTGPLYPWDGLYGGQIVAQALRAAELTIRRGFAPHSLHAFFLRMGDAEEPVRFEVERLRDGRSFVARHVVARQSTGAILNMAISFQAVGEPTMDVQLVAAPEVGPPDTGTEMSWSPLFELRVVQGSYQSAGAVGLPEPSPLSDGDGPGAPIGPRATACSWSRVLEDLGDSPAVHAAALAYVSDSGPAWLAGALHEAQYVPHKAWRPLSLDHSIWFHRPFRADRWLLSQAATLSLYGSRGLTQGRVFDAEGALVASVAQEVFLRRPREGEPSAP